MKSLDYNYNLSKIQECLVNLDMLSRNIFESVRELHIKNIMPDNVIYKLLNQYNFIKLCCFLDELDVLDKLAKDDSYLRDTMYVIAPLRKEVKKWSGLKDTRNRMFAHFNRDKYGNFHPWWITLKGVKIPTTYVESIFVFTLCQLINKLLLSSYRDDFQDSFEKLINEYEKSLKEIDENTSTLTKKEVEGLQVELTTIVEERMREKGRFLFDI